MNQREFLQRQVDLTLSGYFRDAPSLEVAEGDRRVAESQKCQVCGGSCRYVPFYSIGAYEIRGSYIAFAECKRCGAAREF